MYVVACRGGRVRRCGWSKAYLDWQFTYFVLTDDRVIYRTGVFAKHGVEIPLTRINNINFHQGMVDRLVGAGTLEIESAGQDGESRFSHVRHPDGIQQEIYRQMEVHAPDTRRTTAASPSRRRCRLRGRRRGRRQTSPSSSGSSPSSATAA